MGREYVWDATTLEHWVWRVVWCFFVGFCERVAGLLGFAGVEWGRGFSLSLLFLFLFFSLSFSPCGFVVFFSSFSTHGLEGTSYLGGLLGRSFAMIF